MTIERIRTNIFLILLLFWVNNENIFSQNDIKWFPVSHRIVNNSNGTGATQDISFIPIIMQELNEAFLPAGIQFYLSCVGVDTIDYNFNTHLQQQYHCLKLH